MPFLRTLFVACLIAAVAPAAELRTLKGGKLDGDLVRADAKTVVLSTKDGEVSTPVADILQLDLQSPASLAGLRFDDVQLTDGSLLHCSHFTLKGDQVELVVLPEIKVTVPLSVVQYYLSGAHDAQVRKEWQEFLTKQQGNRDILAVKRGDVLNGLEGTFGTGDDKGETIEFELASGQKFRPSLSRIHGMIFRHRPQVNPPETLCKVSDTNHNLLIAQQVTAGPDGCTVLTVAGVKLTYPTLKQVARLDYSKDKLAFLSDLVEQARVQVSDPDGRFELYRRDRNLDDGPLRLAGKGEQARVYPRGLTLFPHTVATFNLGGDYKEFKFVLGSDASVPLVRPVHVIIQGDGRELLTADVKPGSDPQAFTVPVLNVQELRIIVSSDLDLESHVVFADAKISK